MENNKVSLEDVEHIAKLSRLEFSDGQKEQVRANLENIVNYCSMLSAVDTSSVEDDATGSGVVRADVVRESISKQDVVKNAPYHNNSAFIVPRVVE